MPIFLLIFGNTSVQLDVSKHVLIEQSSPSQSNRNADEPKRKTKVHHDSKGSHHQSAQASNCHRGKGVALGEVNPSADRQDSNARKDLHGYAQVTDILLIIDVAGVNEDLIIHSHESATAANENSKYQKAVNQVWFLDDTEVGVKE